MSLNKTVKNFLQALRNFTTAVEKFAAETNKPQGEGSTQKHVRG